MITNLAYREDIKNAELFLQGKQTEVLESLAVKMRNAADDLDYEQAVLFRDQIQTLRRVREKQFVDSGKALDVDVVACAIQRSGEKICCSASHYCGREDPQGSTASFPY
jgi:excinuclease ABC subunit C